MFFIHVLIVAAALQMSLYLLTKLTGTMTVTV
jgi:hypothetical protein